MAVSVKNLSLFWLVIPCISQRTLPFGGIYHFYFHSRSESSRSCFLAWLTLRTWCGRRCFPGEQYWNQVSLYDLRFTLVQDPGRCGSGIHWGPCSSPRLCGWARSGVTRTTSLCTHFGWRRTGLAMSSPNSSPSGDRPPSGLELSVSSSVSRAVWRDIRSLIPINLRGGGEAIQIKRQSGLLKQTVALKDKKGT